MQEIEISDTQAGQRLHKFLLRYFDAAPASFVYRMLRKKNIKYNGKKADGSERLQCGDRIQIYMKDETIAGFRTDGKLPDAFQAKQADAGGASDHPLSGIPVLYESSDVLLVNKPTGMLSQKAKAEDYTLNERIVAYAGQRDGQDRLFTPSVCNRLDRNTSGIVVAGMSLPGSRMLSDLLKRRDLDKYYLTIVSGVITEPSSVSGYLTKKKNHNQVVILPEWDTNDQSDKGAVFPIRTEYRPIVTGAIGEDPFTLLCVKLVTGKTHQIRAHLQSIRHPIVGDGKYGDPEVNARLKKRLGLRHQLLHAYCIRFPEQMPDSHFSDLSGRIVYADPPALFCRAADQMFCKDGNKGWRHGIQEVFEDLLSKI